MLCKNCIHFTVCANVYCEVTEETEIRNIHGKACYYFKDKSKYIELPCKVGDEVYVIKNNKIHAKDVIYYNKIHSRIAEQNDEYWHCVDKDRISINTITFYPEDFGKTVFLAKSEAEQKLKELLGDN